MKRKISLFAAALLLAATACYAQVPDYTNFVPVFQNDVSIYNPYADLVRHIDPKTPVNPAYALSETSALQLSVVLKDYGVTIFHSGPFGWTLSWGFEASRLVPWFAFPDGTKVNAGLLAWYWSHGYPPELVWLWVRGDIRSMLEWGSVHPGAYDWVTVKP